MAGLEEFAEDGEAAFETLESLVAHLCEVGSDETPLAQGYLYLLQGQLQSLRFQRDRGYDVAIGMIENFQRAVAEHVAAGRLRSTELSLVVATLHQAGIPVSTDLAAAIGELLDGVPRSPPDPAELPGLVESIVEACEGSAFMLVRSLAESAHGMPLAVRAGLVEALALSSSAVARDAAVLMLLDPELTIRSAAAAALQRVPTSVSPSSVRRLIAMRNWRPQAERGEIDKLVRAARAAGIDCAAWEAGSEKELLSSALDGSGAQTLLAVSVAGRRMIVSSILCKHGLRDAWCTPPMVKSELEVMLARGAADVGLMRVSRTYVDRIVRHGIQIVVDEGNCAPAGLLEVAEVLGGADWNPDRVDWRNVLAELLAAVLPARLKPAAVAATLQTSGNLVEVLSVADSWFEDDQQVARMLQRGGRRSPEKQVDYLLQTVLERRREYWAEIFVWTALWVREADDADAPWPELVIVADAITKGHDIARIPLMQFVAANTAAAMENLRGKSGR
jgi:hypothetical protein